MGYQESLPEVSTLATKSGVPTINTINLSHQSPWSQLISGAKITESLLHEVFYTYRIQRCRLVVQRGNSSCAARQYMGITASCLADQCRCDGCIVNHTHQPFKIRLPSKTCRSKYAGRPKMTLTGGQFPDNTREECRIG